MSAEQKYGIENLPPKLAEALQKHFDDRKNKTKKPYQHSTTVYLPRKHNEFVALGLKICVARMFGVRGNGSNAKLFQKLIMEHFLEMGLVNNHGEPNIEKFEKELEWIEEETGKPFLDSKKE